MGSMAAVTASGPQLAMGRVVGSLCVVTAKDEDYATGMIASWVSQVGDMKGWLCGVGSVGGLLGIRTAPIRAGLSCRSGSCCNHEQI